MKQSTTNRKTTCSKCGAIKERPTQGYCNACQNAWARENRPTYQELTDEQKRRSNARALLKSYVKRGKIEKKPCCICSETQVEAHIKDYSKPLQNHEWYCRNHHIQVLYQLEVPQHDVPEFYKNYSQDWQDKTCL